MPFIIPLVAKVVAGLATSETGAASTTQSASSDNSSSSTNSVSFSQTVDDVTRNAAAAAQQSAHLSNQG